MIVNESIFCDGDFNGTVLSDVILLDCLSASVLQGNMMGYWQDGSTNIMSYKQNSS